MKPIFIGQAPGTRKADSAELAVLIGRTVAKRSGMEPSALESGFEAMNILDAHPGKNGKGDAFPVKKGDGAAVVKERTKEDQLLLMMGRAVARACGAKMDRPYFEVFSWEGRKAAIIPHPSGINLWWNDGGNKAIARDFMLGLVGTVVVKESEREVPRSNGPRPVPKPSKSKRQQTA